MDRSAREGRRRRPSAPPPRADHRQTGTGEHEDLVVRALFAGRCHRRPPPCGRVPDRARPGAETETTGCSTTSPPAPTGSPATSLADATDQSPPPPDATAPGDLGRWHAAGRGGGGTCHSGAGTGRPGRCYCSLGRGAAPGAAGHAGHRCRGAGVDVAPVKATRKRAPRKATAAAPRSRLGGDGAPEPPAADRSRRSPPSRPARRPRRRRPRGRRRPRPTAARRGGRGRAEIHAAPVPPRRPRLPGEAGSPHRPPRDLPRRRAGGRRRPTDAAAEAPDAPAPARRRRARKAHRRDRRRTPHAGAAGAAPPRSPAAGHPTVPGPRRRPTPARPPARR